MDISTWYYSTYASNSHSRWTRKVITKIASYPLPPYPSHTHTTLRVTKLLWQLLPQCVLQEQAGDADSSRAPGLTSGFQGSMNVHRGALLLVPQWQCISSFVFYILPIFEKMEMIGL